MTLKLKLPNQRGEIYSFTLSNQEPVKVPNIPFKKRVAFSAAHIVADPLSNGDPLNNSAIDWENTIAYRQYLWSLGLSVAEAMDTAQRGMGLDWPTAQQLIKRSVKEAKVFGGRIACGAGTDHLAPSENLRLDDVVTAYEEQCSFVEEQGGQIILMASRALAACAKKPEDYEYVYSKILRQVSEPVIIHWLGEMFDPALRNYWGHSHLDEAMDLCLEVIRKNQDKIDGVKISLLDDEKEIKMRRLLPINVRMYTGDDFNYPSLIKGDEHGYSDALLGIFDAIAPAASAAMHALDTGDMRTYDALLEKTVPLSKHIFEKPTYSYKTGIVFMAFLNGHQTHFRMVGGAESARSIIHLSDLFVLADQAGLFTDPELAAKRMKSVLAISGIQ